MTKTAFLFAGQGAQKLGMASDLYEKYPIVRETFDQASSILGYNLRDLIDKEEDKLNQTRYTQPAILTTSVAIYRLLQEKGFKADMVAGLSFMETAAPAGTGKMVAVMNTEASLIEEICQKASIKGVVTPANYNTPAQIVIGGETEAVNYAVELLKQAGVKRLIPLKVSGPFHTALLAPASKRLSEVLDKVTFSDFEIPLIGNTEAKVMQYDDIKALLARQVKEPVRFYDSIETMRKLGMTEVIEIGPSKVLSGFLRKIDRSIPTASVEDEASLSVLLKNRR